MSHDIENVIIIKTGSTATLVMAYTDDSDPGEPIPLTGYSIFIDFINPKTRVPLARTKHIDGDPESSIGITINDIEGGMYTVNAGDTSDWPLGNIPVDILYSINNVSQHTDAFIINMVQGISEK